MPSNPFPREIAIDILRPSWPTLADWADATIWALNLHNLTPADVAAYRRSATGGLVIVRKASHDDQTGEGPGSAGRTDDAP